MVNPNWCGTLLIYWTKNMDCIALRVTTERIIWSDCTALDEKESFSHFECSVLPTFLSGIRPQSLWKWLTVTPQNATDVTMTPLEYDLTPTSQNMIDDDVIVTTIPGSTLWWCLLKLGVFICCHVLLSYILIANPGERERERTLFAITWTEKQCNTTENT